MMFCGLQQPRGAVQTGCWDTSSPCSLAAPWPRGTAVLSSSQGGCSQTCNRSIDVVASRKPSSLMLCTQHRQRAPLVLAASVASPAHGETSTSCSVRVAQSGSDFPSIGRLRAEAYYEDDNGRFVETFKRQFASQEVESLQQRTSVSTGKTAPQCECLVATDPEDPGTVIGCIDIRLPQSASGVAPPGVPKEDPQGSYILNVVVHEDWRGRGIGKALMRAAMHRAVAHWGAAYLYTHVEADNEVAYRLYRGCGFEEHSSESKFSGATALGKLLLLRAPASAAPASS